MLAKLIKLDLRFAYKQFLAMAALLLVMGLVIPYMDVNIARFGIPLISAIIFAVIRVLCIRLVVQHFQRNLYGNEGYLMFSLPVKASQLLLSKVVTTLIWFNLMVLAALGLVLLLLRENVPLLQIVERLFTWDVVREGLRVLFWININVLPVVLAIFMGISLATVAVRNRKLGRFWGAVAMVGGITLFVWSTTKLGGWQYLDIGVGEQALLSISLAASEWVNLAASAMFCAIFFGLTTHIMRRRLNLD